MSTRGPTGAPDIGLFMELYGEEEVEAGITRTANVVEGLKKTQGDNKRDDFSFQYV